MPRITSTSQRQLTAATTSLPIGRIFNISTDFNNVVSAMALQSDGKILVGGFFTSYGVTQNRITRLNADGTRDTNFDTNTGFAGTGSTVEAIVVQPDGRILIGGSFTSYRGIATQRFITRLEANGSRITSLGTGTNATVLSIALQPDGKILLGGNFIAYSDEILASPYFVRLNANGSRDTEFATGSGPDINSIYAIIVQPDGKILVGGNFENFNGVTAPAITRLNADGTNDTGFTVTSNGFPSNIYAMALQPDGKILVVGEFVNYGGVTQNRITRFNSNGTRDTGFTSGTGFERSVYAIALQPDGKILVGGNFSLYNGVTQNRITRLNADGTRDTGFSIGTGFGGGGVNGAVNAIIVQPDGNILVGGNFSSYNGFTQSYIIRLTSSGSIQQETLPVATYVLTSSTINTGTGFNNIVLAIALQPDGKILLGGFFTSYNGTSQNYITRLNADGTRDTGFTIGTGFNNGVYSIAVQSDGKILVGGLFTTYNGVTQNYITRLNSDGSKDTNLSGTGQGFNGIVETIVLQSDGNIFVGGSFSSYVGEPQGGITRLAGAGGNTYPGFSTGNGFADQRDIRAIAIQSDGKILVGGNFTIFSGVGSLNRLVRLNADGTRDTGFTIGTGFPAEVYAIVVQSDGKILVGGRFFSYNGVTQPYITRLNADGSRDTGFVIGTGFNNDVSDIAVQTDGKILVIGGFTSYNGVTQPYIIRLNADGTRDTGFVIGTGFNNNEIKTIAVLPNGKILVGGNFTAYNGITQNRIVMLNTDGSLSAVVDSVNEGSLYNFVVKTTNVSDSTVLSWRILDRPNDFAVNTGTVTITANSGAFSITPTADQSTEGSETFRVQVEKLSGTVLLTTGNITINDTSTS